MATERPTSDLSGQPASEQAYAAAPGLLADLRSREIMTLRTDVVSGPAERPE